MTVTDPFDLVLFGGSGDLAMRKLLPALYFRHTDGSLNPDGRIICISRSEMSRESFLDRAQINCSKYMASINHSDAAWGDFAKRIDYLTIDATEAAGYAQLDQILNGRENVIRVFFLATAPSLFRSICLNLGKQKLVNPQSRVVLEKPLGRDLASCIKINETVSSVFSEEQIYRIDHYLGKETVQNLIALRFANSLFEPLWRQGHIRNVQITAAEHVGAGGRGGYYDRAGALRDMMQNHLLQLLCIVAMEPPPTLDPERVREEKLKVLRALKPIDKTNAQQCSVRGQYAKGVIMGEPVRGYLEEDDIPDDSLTETFVALNCEIDNWRWAGVPFYLRTGKRMPEKVSEIVVNFKQVPHNIFSNANSLNPARPNKLVIRLQPDEGIKLHIIAKSPGDEMDLRTVALNLDFDKTFKIRAWDAYERLLMDVIKGNLTLFISRDESEQAWRWIEPILAAWESSKEKPHPYMAGSWGPAAAIRMIDQNGFRWHEEG